jgi:DNA polymerase III gamma/tau subunit
MENQSLFKEYKGVFEEEVETPKEKKELEYTYSPFALQDAIGERNVKNIWIQYNKLIFQGIEPEELIHKIVGKVRDMVAIGAGASALDLGVKDYPFNKSKRDLKNWKTDDLKNFYTKLITLYHESRMGGDELGLALEKAILKL